MTPREAALRTAVHEAFSEMTGTEYKRVRREAEATLRDARRDGITQVEVLLPDGTPIGKVSIKAGATAETVDEDALLQWASEHDPGTVEDWADPSALRDVAVVALLKKHFPGWVKPRVRPAAREAWLKEAGAAGGWLMDEETGEKARVVTSETLPATGAFAFTGGKADQRRAAIMAAIREGDRWFARSRSAGCCRCQRETVVPVTDLAEREADPDVHNPVDVERMIRQISNRIASGVGVITRAEREAREKKRAFDLAYAHAYKKAEGPVHVRKYEADILTMPHREEADNADIAFRHAERTARALEKELLAWQSIGASIRTMYGAVRT